MRSFKIFINNTTIHLDNLYFPVLTAILNRLDRQEQSRQIPAAGGPNNPPQNPSPSDLASLSDSIHQLSLSVHAEPTPQKQV